MIRILLAMGLMIMPSGVAFGQDRLLPGDTCFVLNLNVKLALQSKELREIAVPWLDGAGKGNGHQLVELAKVIGIDPLRDLSTITLASGSGRDGERVMLILRGTWNRESVAKRLQDQSVQKGSGFSPSSPSLEQPVYQLTLNSRNSARMHVLLAADGAFIASLSADYVAQVIKAPQRPNFSNKLFQQMVGNLDPNALFTAAVAGEGIDWKMIPEGNVRDAFKAMRGIMGRIDSSGSELKLQMSLESDDAESAAATRQALEDLTGQSLGYVEGLAKNQPVLKGLQTAMKSVKAESKGAQVHLRASLPVAESLGLLNPSTYRQGKNIDP
ncbi:MAG: hypothetical protein ACKO26_22295 [Planctomycetota bacterium]